MSATTIPMPPECEEVTEAPETSPRTSSDSRVSSAPRGRGMSTLLRAAVWGVAATITVVRLRRAVKNHFAHKQDDFAIFHHTGNRLFRRQPDPYLGVSAPNLIPPHAHVVLAPVLGLTRPRAYGVWLGLTAVTLGGTTVIVLRVLRIRPDASTVARVVTLLAGSGLTMASVTSGQIYGVLTLPVTLAWCASRTGHHRTAGALIGVLASMKPNLALVMLAWVRKGNWRALASSIVTGTIALALGLAAFGTAAYTQWLKSVSRMVLAGHFRDGALLQFLWRTFRRNKHFEPLKQLPQPVLWSTWGLSNAALCAITLWRPGVEHDRWWLRVLTLTFLVSPKGWIYSAWWLIGPGISVVSSGSRRSRLLLGAAAVACWLPDRAPKWGQPRAVLTPTWGSLYCWTWLAIWLATFGHRPAARIAARPALALPHRGGGHE